MKIRIKNDDREYLMDQEEWDKTPEWRHKREKSFPKVRKMRKNY